MPAASLGLTVLLLAIPFAYDVLKFAGATYLLWLAWNAIKPRITIYLFRSRLAASFTETAFPDGPFYQFA
jgi:threonine/homoserine/homoserine lactone efflux protein